MAGRATEMGLQRCPAQQLLAWGFGYASAWLTCALPYGRVPEAEAGAEEGDRQ